MPTDAELLRAYAEERSEPAFAEIVARHLNSVYRAALRQLNGNASLAEEVAQTVFAQLARKAGSLSSSTVLAGWLYTTAHYTVANVRRAELRRQRREQEAYLMREDQRRSAPELDWERLRPVLDEALWALKPADREAVLLRFFENHSYGEIAATLRLSDDAARMRVDRALKQLREWLARRNIGSTLAALEATLAAQTAIGAPAGLAAAVTHQAMTFPAPSAGAALLHLMATSKTVLIGAGVIALLAVGTAVQEKSRLAAAETDVAISDRLYHDTLAIANREADQVRAAERAVADLQRQAQTFAAQRKVAWAAGPSNSATTESTPAPASDPVTEGQAFLVRHPEVRTALEQWADANTRANYWELYRQLGLTPDQIREFERLMRAGNGFGRSVPSGTLQFPFEAPSDWKEYMTQCKSLLGKNGYKEFLAYRKEIPAREIAVSLSSLTIDSAMPVTPEQARQLVGIFASASIPKQPQQFDWEAAMPKAQAVLLPLQYEMLENLRTRMDTWQQVTAATTSQ